MDCAIVMIQAMTKRFGVEYVNDDGQVDGLVTPAMGRKQMQMVMTAALLP